ncbi:hypothetical protein NMY22_g4635 [Coprinellus aureogranulatus]|nr:hypothetical protein NMY22_g4635 [Coprinellus aureogranulatus]
MNAASLSGFASIAANLNDSIQVETLTAQVTAAWQLQTLNTPPSGKGDIEDQLLGVYLSVVGAAGYRLEDAFSGPVMRGMIKMFPVFVYNLMADEVNTEDFRVRYLAQINLMLNMMRRRSPQGSLEGRDEVAAFQAGLYFPFTRSQINQPTPAELWMRMTRYHYVYEGNTTLMVSTNPQPEIDGLGPVYGSEPTVRVVSSAIPTGRQFARLFLVPVGSATEEYAEAVVNILSLRPDIFRTTLYAANEIERLFSPAPPFHIYVPLDWPMLTDKAHLGYLKQGTILQVLYRDLSNNQISSTYAVFVNGCLNSPHEIEVLVLPAQTSVYTLINRNTVSGIREFHNGKITGRNEFTFKICYSNGRPCSNIVGGLIKTLVNVKCVRIPEHAPDTQVFNLLIRHTPAAIQESIKRFQDNYTNLVNSPPIGKRCCVQAGPYIGMVGMVQGTAEVGQSKFVLVDFEEAGVTTRHTIPPLHVNVSHFAPGISVSGLDQDGNRRYGWVTRYHDRRYVCIHDMSCVSNLICMFELASDLSCKER